MRERKIMKIANGTVDKVIGERVKHILAAKRIEQKAFALELYIDPSVLSRALAGKRPFTAQELLIIAEQLNMSVDYFYYGDDKNACGKYGIRTIRHLLCEMNKAIDELEYSLKKE